MTDTRTFSERLRDAGLVADRPDEPTAPTPVVVITGTSPQPYLERALINETERVANTAPSSKARNDTLNKAAFNLGQLVAGAGLDEQRVIDALTAACDINRLNTDDGYAATRATIQSGVEAGKKQPRGVPALRATGTASLPPFDPSTGEVLDLAPPFTGLRLTDLDGPLPELDFLIDGRMTRGTLTLLGSKPGVGKSWLAQHAALAVATGACWLGHQADRGRVLYLDAENGERLALRRLQQLGARSADIADRLLYVTESMIFPGGRDAQRLRHTLDGFTPDLVIVDTLASIAPTAEAGTEEAATFLADVWHAVRDIGASMLLLCHLRKTLQGAGKDDPLASFRGAGHLVGAAHRAWVLDPIADERFVLRDVKTREFAAVPPVRVRLVDEGEGDNLRTVVEVEGSVEEVEDGYDAYLALALMAIDHAPIRMVRTKDLKLLDPGIQPRTAERYLARAKATFVLHSPRHGWWARVGDQEVMEDVS